MSDFGLGKDVSYENILTNALRWHGLVTLFTKEELERLKEALQKKELKKET